MSGNMGDMASDGFDDNPLNPEEELDSDEVRNDDGDDLPLRPANHRHQFRNLFPLIRLVTARDGVLDAMGDVVLQDLFLDTAQRGAHRRYLRDDVDAVAVLLDHFRQAANLALDPAETFSDGCLDVLAHAAYIPLPGIGYKAGVQE